MKRTARIATLAAAGAVLPAAACSSNNASTTTTTAAAPTTTAAKAPTTTAAGASPTTTAASGGGPTTTAAAGGSSGAPNLTAPTGAQQLQQGTNAGVDYTRYSITGTPASAITSDYASQLQGQGYTVTNQGSGGGGWGDYGGANSGVTANKGGTYVNVQAGGQNNGPTYFEVCVGPNAQSVDQCEDISNGSKSSGSNSNSSAS